MAVKIRCRRTGANNAMAFRIVATDVRSARDGESLEILGWYSPQRDGRNFSVNLDRVDAWIAKGATLSHTVSVLVKRARKGQAAAQPAPASSAPVQLAVPAEPAPAPVDAAPVQPDAANGAAEQK